MSSPTSNMRYNPPPNWPQPPAGWTPPKDWQPDPAWGPAPAGHQLWVPATSDPAYGAQTYGAQPAYGAPVEPKKKSRKWLWIIIGIVVVIALLSQCGGGDEEPTASTTPAASESASAPAESSVPAESVAPPATSEPAPPPPPPAAIVTTSREMIDTLEGNALNAKNTYEGKTVTVSGVVGGIDASGDYFSLDPEPDAFILTGVQIYTSEDFLAQVATFTEGQPVTVTGEVTGVGEILGYSIEAAAITSP